MKLIMIKKIIAAAILGGGAIVTATALGAWSTAPNPYANVTTSKSKNRLKNDSGYLNQDFTKTLTTLPTYYGPQHKLVAAFDVKLVEDDSNPKNTSILVRTNVGLFYKRKNVNAFNHIQNSEKLDSSYDLFVQKSGWIVAKKTNGNSLSVIAPTFAEPMDIHGLPSNAKIGAFNCSRGYFTVITNMGVYGNKLPATFNMEKYENISLPWSEVNYSTSKVYCQLPLKWYKPPLFFVSLDIIVGNFEYSRVYWINPFQHESHLAPGVPLTPLVIWKIVFSAYNIYIAAGNGRGTGSYVFVSDHENVNFYQASGIAENGYAAKGLVVDDKKHVVYASVDPADGRLDASGIYYATDTNSRISFKKSLGLRLSSWSTYFKLMAVTPSGRVFVRDADTDPTIDGVYYTDSNGQYFTKVPNLQPKDIYNALIPDSTGYAFFKYYGGGPDISAIKPNLSYEKIYVSDSIVDAWAEYGQMVKNRIKTTIYIVENSNLYLITNMLDLIPLTPAKLRPIYPSTLAPAKEYTYEGYAKTTKVFLWTNVYLGINGETRFHLYDYIKLQKENHVNDSVIEANILKKQWKKDNKGFKYSGDIWNVGIDELVHRDWGNWTRGDGKTPIEVHFTTDDLTPLISGYPRWSLTFKGYNYAYNPQ